MRGRRGGGGRWRVYLEQIGFVEAAAGAERELKRKEVER